MLSQKGRKDFFTDFQPLVPPDHSTVPPPSTSKIQSFQQVLQDLFYWVSAVIIYLAPLGNWSIVVSAIWMPMIFHCLSDWLPGTTAQQRNCITFLNSFAFMDTATALEALQFRCDDLCGLL